MASPSLVLMSLNTYFRGLSPSPTPRGGDYPMPAVLRMGARRLGFSNESRQWLQPLASGARGGQGLRGGLSLECPLPDPGEQKSISLPLGGMGGISLSLSEEERECGVCFASAQKRGIKLKCQSYQTRRGGYWRSGSTPASALRDWAPGTVVVGALDSLPRAPPCPCTLTSILTTALQDHWDVRGLLPSSSWPSSCSLSFIILPTYEFGVEEA